MLVPSWLNFLGRARKCDLAEGGVTLGMCFEISEDWCYSQCFSLPVVVSQYVSSQLLPAAMLPTVMSMDSSPRTISPQLKFLL